jgi:hypothetical protein
MIEKANSDMGGGISNMTGASYGNNHFSNTSSRKNLDPMGGSKEFNSA